MRTLVALLPEHLADGRLREAITGYRALLDETLARYEGVPLELFEDALSHGSDRALDAARAMLVEVIQGRDVWAREVTAAAC